MADRESEVRIVNVLKQVINPDTEEKQDDIITLLQQINAVLT